MLIDPACTRQWAMAVGCLMKSGLVLLDTEKCTSELCYPNFGGVLHQRYRRRCCGCILQLLLAAAECRLPQYQGLQQRQRHGSVEFQTVIVLRYIA